jgi:hypothetical protein
MMVSAMRWTALLFLPLLAGAAEIGGSRVNTVYILPMAHGLDQHIANRLTREHIVEVVADSARADALLTDRLGVSLEYQLEKLHPTPKPPDESAKSEADSGKSDKTDKAAGDLADKSDKDKDDKDATNTRRAPRMMAEGGPPRPNAFGGGKGTLFLVDAHSRAVLWSVYEKPKSTSPDELDRTAKRVVTRLKQDLAGK